MRLERFSEDVQIIVQQAQELMLECRHTQLDVEHILLVLLQKREGLAACVLDVLGVDPAVLICRVENELEQRPRVYSARTSNHAVFLAPSTVQLMKRAEQVADHACHGLVRTTHLLRAMGDDLNSASGRALLEYEVTGERIAAALASLQPDMDATTSQPIRAQLQGNQLEERIGVLENAVETLRRAVPEARSEQDALTQAQHQVMALELEIQHLREVLRLTRESLTYTRALLDYELAWRYGEPQLREKAPSDRCNPHLP